MRFKVGDKVLCKKDYTIAIYTNGTSLKIYKDRTYEILEVYMYGENENVRVLIEGNSVLDTIVDYHFYTKEEMRKLKLDKINEI